MTDQTDQAASTPSLTDEQPDASRVAAIANRRRQIQASEERRIPTPQSGVVTIVEASGICHVCGKSFTYESPAVMGRPIPRNWCDDEACTAERARRKAETEAVAAAQALAEAQDKADLAYRSTMPAKWHDVSEDVIPASLQDWTPRKSVFIQGPIGTGKTTLAAALMRRGVSMGRGGAYYRVTRLFGQAIASMNRKDVERPRIIDFPLEPDVLVLDDFGALAPSPFALTLLYDVIDERINHDKGIIVTADLSLRELADAARVGRQTSSTKTDLQRIVDRLVYLSTDPQGYHVKLAGESHRIAAARAARQQQGD